MSKPSPIVDRAVRIELLRARAAIERESVAQGIAEVGRTMAPVALMKAFLPGLASSNASRLALQAVGLARRYPIISSSLSALFMGGGKSSKLLKVGGGAVVAWQLYKAWRTSQDKQPD